MTDTRFAADRRALALLRAAAVVVIVLSERLFDARHLTGAAFDVAVVLAAIHAIAGLVLAYRDVRVERWHTVEPFLDLALLGVLTYTSGGAFSDARKAFFIVPLAAAFSERPRTAAAWSAGAIVVFSAQAAIARGHGYSPNTWLDLTLSMDLYLAWAGAAAAALSLALRRRTEHAHALAASRQQLVSRSIESVERERTRLAGALHDHPVQTLLAARHDLRAARRSGDPASFARLDEALTSTLAQLRAEIRDLHPHVLDHVGLAAALEQLAESHTERGTTVTMTIAPEPIGEHEQALFSLARELLGNAVKHAGATEVHLRLTSTPATIELEVSDDGDGIAPGRLRTALLDGHIGLAASAERVEALGGHFSIEPRTPRGTHVHLALPLERRGPAQQVLGL